MRLDSTRSQALSLRECRELLSSVPIGRIAFTDRALPAVQPVSFRLDGEEIVIRTAAGSRLAASASDAVVAFEADTFDAETRSGWAVTLVGHARAVRSPSEIVRLSRLPLIPWTPGGTGHFITVGTGRMAGLRILR
ncbi:pyridoxamine 5'-phosphate oxidase [Streptosporangium violaceochromogenes]|nr:pyridoxamine 5'-phosphate oxidase [Streptosporangium violaceochromogenes]